jgi:uncharacterized protein YndB with AHSA1/START domain
MTTKERDRISAKIVLRSPRARVWHALTDSEELGRWFGIMGIGPLSPGATVRGMYMHEGFEHVPFEVVVERLEPERVFSFRWHPFAVDPDVDYSVEPRTLVVFTLEDTRGGTILSVVESGFGGLPPGRREKAYAEHTEGWTYQLKAVEQFLVKAA